MQLFYSHSWSQTEPFFLSEEESKHSVSVLRHQVGDKIHIIDGKGSKLICEILVAHPKKTQLKFIEKIKTNQRASELHIAISPTKSNDRFEWFLEKACEIGVGKITPIIFQRTERNKVNIERWNKIIQSACKQAQVFHFPLLEEAIKFEKWITTCLENTFVASIGAVKKISDFPKTDYATIVIGPEGDFSEEEFRVIRDLGLKEVSLSKNVLRVETAGLVALTQVGFLANV
ncbi:MAG: 16S rRNA (uracil(1498)-N(3))-methyltransferase [Chitinophagales bacterium]|nr:16S rRNA (uracil(1498)-N(3))-methyltransferase [Chitinophagales bacterium]